MSLLVIKSIALLVMIGAAGWATIKYQHVLRTGLLKLGSKQTASSIRIHETLFLGPGQRLVVLDFEDTRLLVSASGRQLTVLHSQPKHAVPSEPAHSHA